MCDFARKILRRECLPAIFILLLFASMNVYSQEVAQTSVSNIGVIENKVVEEKVSDEDVERIQKLNEETSLEYNTKDKDRNDTYTSETAEDYTEDDFDDFDEIFGSAEDTETAITTATTETVKPDPKDKPITFNGSLKAELGGNIWFSPLKDTSPLASFRNILQFVGRPSTDFYVTGSLLMDFQDMEYGQEMDIGLYELYFNYTLFGLVDVAAGKRDVSWSLSRMLDTNILDDKREPPVKDVEEVMKDVFYKRDRTTKDSKFTVNVNIPIFSYGSIQGVAQYYLFDDIKEFTGANISLAGKIEGTLGKFSLGFLTMRWPDNMPDDERPYTVLGLELISSILGKNSNIFVQGLMHIDPDNDKKFNSARISTGIYKYWQNPIMLGVAFEYQGIFDEQLYGSSVTKWGDWQHYFAAQIAWSHFIFGRKWTFGCEWFHDVREGYGSVLPVMKIEDVIKYTDFRVGVPIYYGSEKKYGLVFEVILNLDY